MDFSQSQSLEEIFQEDDIEKELFCQPEVEDKPSPLSTSEHQAAALQSTHKSSSNADAVSPEITKSMGIDESVVANQPLLRCGSSTDVKIPLLSQPTVPMQVPIVSESQVSVVTEPSLTRDASLNSSGFTTTRKRIKRATDPLRNKHVCYIGRNDNVQDLPRSKFYVYSSFVDYSGDMGEITARVNTAEPPVAEFFLTASNIDDFKIALTKLQELQNHQDVQVSHLYLENCFDDDDHEDRLELDGLKLSKNVKQIVITNCKFSGPVYGHITGQLACCQNLELLHLEQVEVFPDEFTRSFSALRSLKELHLHQCRLKPEMFKAAALDLLICENLEKVNLSRTTGIPVEFGAALKMMTRLKIFEVRHCQMTTAVSESVMKGLSNCQAIEHFGLSGNTLKNCVTHLLSGDHFCELKVLLLDNAQLSADDLKSIAKSVSNGCLRRLKTVKLSGNNLAGCMQNLFNEDDFPEYQALQSLQLDDTNLTKTDLNCLAKAVEDCQLPQLKVLDVSDNSIKSDVVELLDENNHTGYKNLEKLILKKVDLGKSNVKDIRKMSALINDKKVPNLRSLSLSENNLENRCKDVFGKLSHQGLQRLFLQNTNINSKDVKRLSEVFEKRQLPNLQELNLSYNTLTGCLGHLFNTAKKGDFQLRRLSMKNSKLNKEDLTNLNSAIEQCKLSKLQFLNLDSNELDTMKRVVVKLINACSTVYTKQPNFKLSLRFNDLTEAFLSRFDSHTRNLLIVEESLFNS